MTLMHVEQYDESRKAVWDQFVRQSKNGTFLFLRDYMDYHADRFTDHSLLFFEEDQLVAIMPANIANECVISHGGLTFGGVLSDNRMRMALMLEVFKALLQHLELLKVKQLTYKAIPHIYHRIPAEEDLYALFAHDARLSRRDVSSTIFLPAVLGFSKGRKGCVKKGIASGLSVTQSDEYETFMQIEEAHLLQKHSKRPVHTAAELRLLASRFPEHINLFAAYKGNTMMGGVVMYGSFQVAHAQYIAATQEGMEIGALDVVMDFLIHKHYQNGKRYFDFGISTEREGRYLNAGLISNKESFGARTTVYDFYEVIL